LPGALSRETPLKFITASFACTTRRRYRALTPVDDAAGPTALAR
jgi:hypothetical protein